MTKKNYNKDKKTLGPKMKKAVKKVVKDELAETEELKHWTNGFGAISVYSGGGYQQQNLLTNLLQSTTDFGRIGDELYLKQIHCKVKLMGPVTTTGANAQAIRIMIFQYKVMTTVAAVPNINELLLVDTAGGGVRSAYSMRNWDFADQYVMLYDKTYIVTSQNTMVATVDSGHAKWFEINVPLKYAKKKVQYTNASSTNMYGGIWFGVIGSEPTIAGSNASCAMECQVRYTDA